MQQTLKCVDLRILIGNMIIITEVPIQPTTATGLTTISSSFTANPVCVRLWPNAVFSIPDTQSCFLLDRVAAYIRKILKQLCLSRVHIKDVIISSEENLSISYARNQISSHLISTCISTI